MVAIAFVIICIGVIYDFVNAYKNFGDSNKYVDYMKQAVIKFVVGFLLAVSLAS